MKPRQIWIEAKSSFFQLLSGTDEVKESLSEEEWWPPEGFLLINIAMLGCAFNSLILKKIKTQRGLSFSLYWSVHSSVITPIIFLLQPKSTGAKHSKSTEELFLQHEKNLILDLDDTV